MRALPLVLALFACKPPPDFVEIPDLPPVDIELAKEFNEERFYGQEVVGLDVMLVVSDMDPQAFEEPDPNEPPPEPGDTTGDDIYQQTLVDNFPEFLEYFRTSGFDWRIGVLPTNVGGPGEEGALMPYQGVTFVDSDTPEPLGILVNMGRRAAQVGQASGGGTLRNRGFDQIKYAIENDNNVQKNNSFLRVKSNLALVTISRRNDNSFRTTANQLRTALGASKPSGMEQISYFTVHGPNEREPQHVQCKSDDGVEEGTRYYELMTMLDGTYRSICDPTWTDSLSDIGFEATIHESVWYLAGEPVPETLEVSVSFRHPNTNADMEYTFDPEAQDRFRFEYDPQRNAVIFPYYLPPFGAEVLVRYQTLESYQATEGGGGPNVEDTGLQ